MKITLSNEINHADFNDEIMTAIKKAFEEAQIPFKSCVNILITDNEGIQKLNLEFRNIDAPTDVLSFPAYEFSGLLKDCINSIQTEEIEGDIFLGDIAISIERAKTQSEEYNHSLLRESVFLALHGLLHLIGYDHTTKEETQAMEEMQEKILDKINIKRV